MAKVLTGISQDTPPQSLSPTDTFSLAGTPSFTGGGGVQRYDFRWEVDSGGGFVPIAASGTGLVSPDTNPLVNTNSQAQNAMTVTCDQAGEYTVRMVGAPTSGGSYTVVSATQTVSVSSGPEEHFGTVSVSGGGGVSAQGRKGAQGALQVSGGGGLSVQATTGKNGVLTVLGGGSMAIAYTTSNGGSPAAPAVAKLSVRISTGL